MSFQIYLCFNSYSARPEPAGLVGVQARNQDFMWGGGGGGGADEAKEDQTTEMYFLLSDPFI